MAISTTYATIQMRRGMRKDFDPYKMSPGEWAVSIDPIRKDQMIWMCFAPGFVKRLGTYEDFYDQIEEATEEIKNEYIAVFNGLKDQYIIIFNGIRDEAEEYANQAKGYANTAGQHAQTAKNHADASAASATNAASSASAAANSADQSDDFSKLSESHSHGGTGVRPGEDTDNSKYWSEQSRAEYERVKNEADRASMYADFVEPDFILQDNRLYLNTDSTVDFKVDDNRLYFKLPA